MILYTRDFPSKGYGCNVESIEIRPLTYKELVDYTNNDELTKLRKFKKDLDYLVLMSPQAEDLYLIDLEYVLFMMKMVTISKEHTFRFRYTCDCCHKSKTATIGSQSIVFRDIDERYLTLDHIELGGKNLPFRLTTLAEFKAFIAKLPRQIETTPLDTIKLASMLWDRTAMSPAEVIGLINNAVGDEIKLVSYLKSALLQPIKPITLRCEKGGETVVALSDVTTDLFPLTLLNRRLDITKIHFKQIRQDTDD
jgi:hypothetical protein